MVEGSKSALGRSSGGGHEGVSVGAVPAENVLEFPPDVGLKFVITKPAADTDGEFIELEGTMLAHSAGPQRWPTALARRSTSILGRRRPTGWCLARLTCS
jgi:hypothetical protein